MMSDWALYRHIRPALTFLAVLTLVTGLAYPAAISWIAQEVVPGSANGSLVRDANGTAIASSLLGQNITCAYENQSALASCPYRALLWTRPALTDYIPFTQNGTGAGSESPYGPTDPTLYNQTVYFMEQYGVYNVTATIPIDLVTQSQSGLDPDLTPEAALVQVPRVAHFSGLSEAIVLSLVDHFESTRDVGWIGPAFVNIIQLDIALLQQEHRGP